MKNKNKLIAIGGIVGALALTFSFSQTTFSAGPNLIQNSAFETANGSAPASWQTGKWGTNTTTFTYPVTGRTGNAAEVKMTAYTSGDAKWYPANVAVTPGTAYTYSDWYKSTASSRIVIEYTLTNGTKQYVDLTAALPAAATWTQASGTLTPPANTASVTFMHILASVGTLAIDDASLTSNTGTSDTQAPAVTLTTPVASSTLSGTVNLSATASDNVGVVGVKFLIDNVITGVEDTTSPYATTWNTTTVTNGTHTVTAIARDAAGNTGTSTVSVTVNNTVTPPPPAGANLISNNSLETANPAAPTLPTSWQTGKWGTNTTTFTYPVAGQDGAKAASINVTAYTSGDVKWYFNDVNVTPGTLYTFSNFYKSSVATNITVQFKKTDGSFTYLSLGNPAAATAWTQFSATFTPPAGTVSVTVFHLINKVGTLSVDNYSLTAPATSDTQAPTVTVTSPIANATVSGTATFTATASDNVGVLGVQFFIDGTAAGAEDTSNPYSISFDTTTLSNGTHSIMARAKDTSLNIATSSAVSFTVSNTVADTQAPTITVTSPVASTTVSGALNFTASSTDNVAVAGVQFFLDNAVFGAEDITAPYSISFNSTTTTNGSHNVFARARDTSGNVATSSVVTFTVNNVVADTTLPTVAIVSPADGSTASSTINVTVTGNDNIALAGLNLTIDGISYGTMATTSPAVFSLDTKQYTNGTHTIGAKATDTSGNIATTSIQMTIANPVPDLTAPVVSITSPIASSTVSGMMTVNVTATDNVSVSDVHIMIDGDSIGVDATSPYSASLDTNTLTNGIHIATAYAEDAAGNIGNASSVSFTVYNYVTPVQPNSIQNPSLETANPNNAALPEKWSNGSWGTNNAVFTYPVAGFAGAKAARIQITSYTDGDAKWVFDDASTTPENGDIYVFKDEYRSDVATMLVARFTLTNGSTVYREIIEIPASNTWKTAQATISIPADTASMTIFHILRGVGFLEVDDFYLYSSFTDPSNIPFDKGYVSFTFDDGWLSQFTNARPVLNAANMKAGYYIISQETIEAVPNNRINNANLETVDNIDENTPDNWNAIKTGTSNATFTYPVAGHTVGSKAVKVDVTSYTDGEAAWVPVDASVISGQEYEFSGYYKSTALTPVIAKYTDNNDVITYVQIGSLPPAANWTQFSRKFFVTNNLKGMSVYLSLKEVGSVSLDDVDLERVIIYMNPSQVVQLMNEGQEIGAHTQHHPDLRTLNQSQATAEIAGSRTDILGFGATPVDTFIYPYGGYNDSVIQTVKDAGFIGARSVDQGYNFRNSNKYTLQVQDVNKTTTLAQFQSWVNSAKNHKTWLILMFHQVDNSGLEYAVDPALFQEMVDYLAGSNTEVITMKQGLGKMLP